MTPGSREDNGYEVDELRDLTITKTLVITVSFCLMKPLLAFEGGKTFSNLFIYNSTLKAIGRAVRIQVS